MKRKKETKWWIAYHTSFREKHLRAACMDWVFASTLFHLINSHPEKSEYESLFLLHFSSHFTHVLRDTWTNAPPKRRVTIINIFII
ncbi:LOW QUALITY PROTEIN: hypothetical protein TorRG33x02_314270 [Trema orientale]|uniref:Uncharacterized protein n=1 Tax=Trema orientale TaxID=63057 RepID=A0A2P5BNX4_TREOI|nr:LOW QUALITY PROTEIN: hypothetical protein TorRG33x02_314270 [Trema orientale]